MVVQKESEATKVQALQAQVAALERALGQKQMVIDYQDKLLKTDFYGLNKGSGIVFFIFPVVSDAGENTMDNFVAHSV